MSDDPQVRLMVGFVGGIAVGIAILGVVHALGFDPGPAGSMALGAACSIAGMDICLHWRK